MDLSYIINELGEERENYFNAICPPIIQSSNFAFPDVNGMRQGFLNESRINCYTRGRNPTVDILCKKLAALEKMENALIFGSGTAAIANAVISCVNSGDHIVCVKSPYNWTGKLLEDFLPRFGITTTMVDGTNPLNYEQAIRANTKLLYLESPNSITFELQNLESVGKIAKKYGIKTIIDNSYATPLNQSPADFGIDLIVHTLSKYVGGHSDIVAGAICGSNELIEKIFHHEYMTLGAIISPFDAWLAIRGLRTLPLRLEKISKTALEVAEKLVEHPKIEKVIYPFLPSFPQHELAKEQMKSGGGLFTLVLKSTDLSRLEDFSNKLKRFHLAVSWGGHDALILPSCAFSHLPHIPPNMVRFYVGLTEPEILIRDIESALEFL